MHNKQEAFQWKANYPLSKVNKFEQVQVPMCVRRRVGPEVDLHVIIAPGLGVLILVGDWGWRQTDRNENNTFEQLRWRAVISVLAQVVKRLHFPTAHTPTTHTMKQT